MDSASGARVDAHSSRACWRTPGSWCCHAQYAGKSNPQVPPGMPTRLRMLISQSFSVSKCPDLPDWVLRAVKQRSSWAMTASRAASEIEGVGAGNQFSQPAEQLLKPQIGSETLVEGIFVKDHAGGFLGAQGVF